MNGLLCFIGGLGMGVWATVQAKALHIALPHLPVFHHVDPVPVLLAVIVVMLVFSMRGKRTGGKS